MFGKDRTRRGRDTEEAIRVMRQAWTGEPFEYQGRTAWVTPKPVTQPHPMIMVGRLGAGLGPAGPPGWGCPICHPLVTKNWWISITPKPPRPALRGRLPWPPDGPGLVLVTEDSRGAVGPKIGPNMLYDAQAYASWQYPDQRSGWHVEAEDVADLKASGQFEVLTPDQCVNLVRTKGAATLHPLCGRHRPPPSGGKPWNWLSTRVMPALAEGA